MVLRQSVRAWIMVLAQAILLVSSAHSFRVSSNASRGSAFGSPLTASLLSMRQYPDFDEKVCPHQGKPKYRSKFWCPRLRPRVSKNLRKLSEADQLSLCSQFGQDGVLARVYRNIGVSKDPYFVEFGSRRPQMLNSGHWRLNCGWKGLLMDALPGNTIIHPCSDCPDIGLVKDGFVHAENVLPLFQKYGVPPEPDLVTIDFDWNELWVFQKLITTNMYSPRVIVVEFERDMPNTMAGWDAPGECRARPLSVCYDPYHIYSITFAEAHIKQANVEAFCRVAEANGYSYVWAVNEEHLVFVRTDLLSKRDRDHFYKLRLLRGNIGNPKPIIKGAIRHEFDSRFLFRKEWVVDLENEWNSTLKGFNVVCCNRQGITLSRPLRGLPEDPVLYPSPEVLCPPPVPYPGEQSCDTFDGTVGEPGRTRRGYREAPGSGVQINVHVAHSKGV